MYWTREYTYAERSPCLDSHGPWMDVSFYSTNSAAQYICINNMCTHHSAAGLYSVSLYDLNARCTVDRLSSSCRIHRGDIQGDIPGGRVRIICRNVVPRSQRRKRSRLAPWGYTHFARRRARPKHYTQLCDSRDSQRS